jgi:HD domain
LSSEAPQPVPRWRQKREESTTAPCLSSCRKMPISPWIPAEILSKPTRLTKIEFDLIKTHAQSGYDILKDIDFPWLIARMVLEHHERMNGSGYPHGLTRDNLLLESRILAVADVVESMASHRPYRPTLGIKAAPEEIEKNRGTIYDNTVAEACLILFREGSAPGDLVAGVGGGQRPPPFTFPVCFPRVRPEWRADRQGDRLLYLWFPRSRPTILAATIALCFGIKCLRCIFFDTTYSIGSMIHRCGGCSFSPEWTICPYP